MATRDRHLRDYIRDPYKTLVYTGNNPASGYRLSEDNRILVFLIAGQGTPFDTETHTMDIYSEREEQFFRKRNRAILHLFQEYTPEDTPEDTPEHELEDTDTPTP